jgi:hypothetical protein
MKIFLALMLTLSNTIILFQSEASCRENLNKLTRAQVTVAVLASAAMVIVPVGIVWNTVSNQNKNDLSQAPDYTKAQSEAVFSTTIKQADGKFKTEIFRAQELSLTSHYKSISLKDKSGTGFASVRVNEITHFIQFEVDFYGPTGTIAAHNHFSFSRGIENLSFVITERESPNKSANVSIYKSYRTNKWLVDVNTESARISSVASTIVDYLNRTQN